MKKQVWLIVISFLMISIKFSAQVKDTKTDSLVINNPLKGLKKAGPGDIDPSIPLMLDPSTTPIYFEDFSRIQETDFMSVMVSGDYMPEPYVDSDKVVRAFVMRKATDEEKKQMQQMQGSMEADVQNTNEHVGKKAIKFSVTDIYGKNYSLKDLKGKVIVMNFWFVECKPCIMEMPELNGLVEKYKGKDVVFLGFATNDKQKIERFLETKTYKYNVIADSKEIADSYEVKAFPTHIVIDRKAIISYYVTGFGPTTIVDLDRSIDSLLK
jgi:peroxiredoxin